MAKIKHIALTTENPTAVAAFYQKAFDMQEIHRSPSGAVFLTDGYINLAIIDFHTDDVAGAERGAAFEGLHHIGVQIDASERIPERLAEAGYAPRDDINRALGIEQGAGAANTPHEFKFGGPDGVVIDISGSGWEGTDGPLDGDGR